MGLRGGGVKEIVAPLLKLKYICIYEYVCELAFVMHMRVPVGKRARGLLKLKF